MLTIRRKTFIRRRSWPQGKQKVRAEAVKALTPAALGESGSGDLHFERGFDGVRGQ
jgi:hypothetical protein